MSEVVRGATVQAAPVFLDFYERMDVITSLLVHCAIESNAQGGKALAIQPFLEAFGI